MFGSRHVAKFCFKAKLSRSRGKADIDQAAAYREPAALDRSGLLLRRHRQQGGDGANQLNGNQLAFRADNCSVSKRVRNLAIAAASGGPVGVTSFTSSSKYCS